VSSNVDEELAAEADRRHLSRENPHASRARPQHPKGWEPCVEIDGNTATAVSTPTEDANPDHADLVRGWNLDPEVWKIVGKVNVRRWQTYDERWLHYYRADLVRRDLSRLDLDEVVARVIRRAPRQVREATGDRALVVSLADWQVGKGDGFTSADRAIEATHERIADMIGKVEDRWRELRRAVPLSTLYVLGLGDLGEACHGHYAQQGFRTVLNVRDQRKVVRWGLDSALDAWARLAPEVHVKAVGGNHGEEREDGKSNTDFADNRDVAVFEDVAFAYAKNDERYGHVSFALPHDDLTLTFDHEGTIVGIAHGHQAGFNYGNPIKKIEDWWAGQMKGQLPIGDADVLVTGHYHHFWCRQLGRRTHFGSPALELQSDWWRNTAGLVAPPGTLTFELGPDGWSHLEIL